ncbi:MAG: hypothetical protein CMK09_01865 [Ponticaulis sp.]|nr:hypothetical protein [Ponticaulis sp.]|tara:strand:+ start:1212 stop:1811 length:600 start_codon:yes stop_codon:yes gene_type:complete
MTRRRKLTSREARMWQKVTKSVRQIENRHPDPEPEDDQPTPPSPDVSRENMPPGRERANSEDLEKLLNTRRSPVAKPTPLPDAAKRHAAAHGLADRSREKRVRRGKFDLGPTLDLHGHTQESARATLLSFVRYHRTLNASSVLVITGKGRAGDGILRRRFTEWIAETEFRSHVSGFSQAHQKHGGEGAYYLFLRKASDK